MWSLAEMRASFFEKCCPQKREREESISPEKTKSISCTLGSNKKYPFLLFSFPQRKNKMFSLTKIKGKEERKDNPKTSAALCQTEQRVFVYILT